MPAVTLALAGVAAVLFGFDIDHLRGRIFAKSHAVEIHSVAVLPLVNLSSDPDQEYFSDGMTDELITDLAKFGNLRVISHTSVERYKQTKRPIAEIARELGVDAVVEGRVLRSRDRVRITAQLIDARSDQHLWAQSYDRDFREMLSLQAEVAQRIASQVDLSLAAGERERFVAPRPVDPAAHEAYLRGNFHWSRLTCRGYLKAQTYFEEAVSRDPDFPRAYSGLSDSYFNLAEWGCLPKREENFVKSRTAALRALELDPGSSTAHATLGELALYHDWNWPEAESQFKQAIELDHNDAVTHTDYSIFLIAMGRSDEAFAEMNLARQLDPTSEVTNVKAIYVLYLGHRFDRALEQANRTLELYPSSPATYFWIGEVYEALGMDQKAGTAYVKDLGGAPSEELLIRRRSFETGGLRGFWQQELKKKARKGLLDSCWEPIPYAHVGDRERTLSLLEQGFQHHCDGLQFLATEPIYDKFRADPRFQSLLHRLNLPTIQFPN
jgi:TolB-like protein/lipoprotein NlpI